MYSKTCELLGLSAIAVAIAFWATWEAGLLFVGFSLLFVGSTLNDSAISGSLRRGRGWIGYAWHRQLLRENGIRPPKIRATGLPGGWVPCGCGGQEDCPLCDGTGAVPDPEVRVNARSPHPPIKVNPEAETFWENVAQVRQNREGPRNGSRQRIA